MCESSTCCNKQWDKKCLVNNRNAVGNGKQGKGKESWKDKGNAGYDVNRLPILNKKLLGGSEGKNFQKNLFIKINIRFFHHKDFFRCKFLVLNLSKNRVPNLE